MKIQNNIHILNFPTLFSARFPRLQDKRAGIKKNSIVLYLIFVYTLESINPILKSANWPGKKTVGTKIGIRFEGKNLF